MAVSYDKLFHLLIDKKITNSELMKKANISANIISKLKHGEYISMESIENICKALSCSPNEIMDFTEDKQ